MSGATRQQGFLLTRNLKDTPQGMTIVFWLSTPSGPLCLEQTKQQRICFIGAQQKSLTLSILQQAPYGKHHWQLKPLALKSFANEKVLALYVNSDAIGGDLEERLKQAGVILMEAGVRPEERFLMERFITGGMAFDIDASKRASTIVTDVAVKACDYKPNLTCVSLDIETTLDGKHIHSIAVYGRQQIAQTDTVQKVWLHWPKKNTPQNLPAYATVVANERQLLQHFIKWITEYDPDVFIGWSVVQFDFQILCQRAKDLGVRLRLGRGGEEIRWRQGNQSRTASLYMPGRAALDGIEVMRAATWQFESFALENVAQKLLGRGKDITQPHQRGAEIQRLYHESPAELVAYNLEDCRLVWDIFIKADLLNFVVARSQLTGLPMERIGGSAQAFDHLYLPRLHRAGFVAPAFASGMVGESPGGFVMDSNPGLYSNVLVLDFKSLYPSIIRSFLIDPLGLIKGATDEDSVAGFKGAKFSRHSPILPDIIALLWQARDQAKACNNMPLSTSIKIVMNSCYGVLGSDKCRFYDQRLASSITQRGHEILKQTKTLIESKGYHVIYGDTDSVFVWLGEKEYSISAAKSQGESLARWLNQWWQQHLQDTYSLVSYLEIEFETLFRRFVMPTVRGQKVGSKKRYAGVMVKTDRSEHMVFKGLENVRSDWTPMARQLQNDLYQKIFNGQDYEALIKYTITQINMGAWDEQLIYRKRIRRSLDDYVKNVPPHIQAAKKAEVYLQRQGLPSRYQNRGFIEYVITKAGAEVVDLTEQPLDYEHYIQRQLRPIVDGILNLCGDSFARIVDKQLGLFDAP